MITQNRLNTSQKVAEAGAKHLLTSCWRARMERGWGGRWGWGKTTAREQNREIDTHQVESTQQTNRETK